MSTALAEPPVELVEFEIVPANLGLTPDARHSLELSFADYFAQAAKWKAQAESITSPKLARAARLEIKALRCAADKKRKELKEESLRMGKAIDGANNILLAFIVPIEQHLEEIEKAEERRIAAEIAARGSQRFLQLQSIGVSVYTPDALGRMADEDYNALYADAKALHEARIERERKEAEEALARQVAEAKERERIREENERLLREAAEREAAAKIEREKADAERKALEAKLVAEREAAERKAAAEAAKVKAEKEEAARVAHELLLKAQAAADAQRREAEAKAKAEREALERKAAEERAAREKIERAAAEAEAARKFGEAKKLEEAEQASLAPDRDKFQALAASLRSLPRPIMATKKGEAAMVTIETKLSEFAAWIEKKAVTL